MGDDYIDYTLLKKRGLLKLKEESLPKLRAEGDFLDLREFATNSGNTQTGENSTSSPGGNNNFDFLGDMAGVGSNNSTNSGYPTPTSSANSLSISDSDLNALKIKLDDMEYKLERFIERIDKMKEKLSKEEN